MFHALLLAAATATLTPAQIDAVLANVEKSFSAYVFPDVAARTIAMLKANAPRYEALSDPQTFRKAVNEDLYASTHDKHVTLWYPFDEHDSDEDNSAAAVAQRRSETRARNFGFVDVRRLAGNVGYIDFRGFSGDPEVAKTIAATMTFVANTDALIIDLRRNGGGDPSAASLLEGYFFASPQQVTSIENRDRRTGKMSETKQFTANVSGPKYVNKPIYVLTSNWTFSCAEQFTYDLHNLHRVTVVGETTGGGANPGDVHYAGNQFGVFIPEGYAHSPVTGTNWESVGIAPDVATTSADALKRGYDLALHFIGAHSNNEAVLDQVKTALEKEDEFLNATL